MTDESFGSARIGVDFGTSHTIAMIGGEGRPSRALLFEGSPLLPSAVFADGDELLVGRFALQHGRRAPASLEPHPKRRIDLDSILLGEREVDTADAVAAVLARVRAEATRVAGALAAVTITVPATWGPTRRQVMADAAERAGLGAARLVPEPVAAAAYFVRRLGHRIADGQAVAVYDLGAGTFDATVVARRGDGFEVLAQDGRDDLGGLDIDAAIADHLGLADDADPGERARRYRALLEEIRLAKESLSTYTRAEFTVPHSDADAHLTRGELEDLARPLLAQTVKVTKAVIAAAGLTPERTAGVFLVGGASRMPLAATMLHQALGVAPTAIEQPELVVAEGGLIVGTEDAAPAASADAPGSAPADPPPVYDYRPGPVGPAAPPAPTPPDRTPAAVPPDRTPPAASAPRRRMPASVVAAVVLLALAVPLMSMWAAAIEKAVSQGEVASDGWEMLFGGSYVILNLVMLASPLTAVLLSRRVRGAPVLGFCTSVAALLPVIPFLSASAVTDLRFTLALSMVVVFIAIIAYLSGRAAREWFADAPRTRDAGPRAGTAVAGIVAVLLTILLALVLNDLSPEYFW